MPNTPAKRIQSITLQRIPDSDLDTSYLGTYSDTAETEFAIDRRHTLDCTANDPANREAAEKLGRVLEYLGNVPWHRLKECGGYLSDASIIVTAAQDQLTGGEATEDRCTLCGRPFYLSRDEYRYFNPGSVEAFDPSASWLAEIPEPQREDHWRTTMRNSARADYDRMQSYERDAWGYLGIVAEAAVIVDGVTQRIQSGGLWGIESDSEPSHFAEVEGDELSELKRQLYALGFSKRAISKAVQSIQRKGE